MAYHNDYIEVKDRISLFLAEYPEGSLQGKYEFVETSEGTLIVYTAKAYRSENDKRPGIGTASEPFPGKTAFTRGSEIMNAETSAWGRALAALGVAAHKGVASASDIRKAQAEETQRIKLQQVKQRVLDRGRIWAEDNDKSFNDASELVKTYLDARGIKLPGRDDLDAWQNADATLDEEIKL